jgi:hypothetical protein
MTEPETELVDVTETSGGELEVGHNGEVQKSWDIDSDFLF